MPKKVSHSVDAEPVAHLEVWARPASRVDRLEWDPWRRRWQVHCRALPQGGAANESILRLLARWIDVEPDRLRWIHSGRGRAKLLAVGGLTEGDLRARLERAAARTE